MPSKMQFYAQMADQAAKQITGSYQSWISFLQTAGRLYKYPYNEQVTRLLTGSCLKTSVICLNSKGIQTQIVIKQITRPLASTTWSDLSMAIYQALGINTIRVFITTKGLMIGFPTEVYMSMKTPWIHQISRIERY